MTVSLTIKLISELGNSTGSILPIWAKDIAQDTATTLVYKKNGGKHDGKEKAIEEYGTGIVWVLGIPFMKKLIDKTVYKLAKINPSFDIRKLKEGAEDSLEYSIGKADQFKLTKQLNHLNKIKKNKKLTKGLFVGKFAFATGISLAALAGLIHLKQKTTEKDIKKKLVSESIVNNNLSKTTDFKGFKGQCKSQDVSFKGVGAILSNFMYNPVWNMSILDGAISGTRLKKARKGEKGEVLFKEATAISFFYLLAGPIQKGLEALSKKLFKTPIDLDYKVLADKDFKNAISDGTLNKAIKYFNALNLKSTEVLDFAWDNQENILVKMLKKSGAVPTAKDGSIDALKLMKSDEILSTVDKMKNFIDSAANKNLDKYAKKVKGLKIASILGNIGIAVLVLGIIQPLLTIKLRKLRGGDKENPAVKNVENEIKLKLQQNA